MKEARHTFAVIADWVLVRNLFGMSGRVLYELEAIAPVG
jgi:hypothetical protein